MNERLGKSYKLKSKKIIESLFNDGETVKQFPFLLKFNKQELPSKEAFQIVFSVSKRRFKKAPDRNRIKRLMREVIRKNKHSLEALLQQNNQQLALFLIYTNTEIMSCEEMNRKIVLLFERLISQLSSNEIKA
ncbi:MAG: ribonuclease P protein component [Crocinitomicaceae bacterium]|nr:ribonuclease P protein component [Crocinitomicaceae bacterium]